MINLPSKGITKVPGSEYGFQRFYSDYILYRDDFVVGKDIVNLENIANNDDELVKFAKAKSNLLNSDNLVLFLGGDHSTTEHIFECFEETHGIPFFMFDAHVDYGETTMEE
jgi:Arginase/agmatinase/formimionoglutamate hydrolase, arginase family